MLSELLHSLDDQNTAELVSREEELELLTTRLKEEKKFLMMLSNEEGETSVSFSPRTGDENKKSRLVESKEKLDELREKKELCEQGIAVLKNNQQNLQTAIAEFEELLEKADRVDEVMDEKAPFGKFVLKDEAAPEETLPEKPVISDYSVINDILFKIETMSGYVLSDPMRAKVELSALKRMVEKL
ncbi:MAG: hypothetical protein ILP08_01435 [Lachnospiraceae bacterium]|nr:hypothetical protein [Lachnospiraceae bacterium]